VVQEFSSRSWDMIYIDGNHEYEAVAQDFANCAKVLSPGGKIILDDSARHTSYRPPPFATPGHPGPSRLASEIQGQGYREILCVGHNRVFEKST
jgi:predicted O-methyltransferase YrrM